MKDDQTQDPLENLYPPSGNVGGRRTEEQKELAPWWLILEPKK